MLHSSQWLRACLTALVVSIVVAVAPPPMAEAGKPAPPSPPTVTYTMTLLGLPDGCLASEVCGMNNLGDVLGYVTTSDQKQRPAVWWASGRDVPEDLSVVLTDLVNLKWGSTLVYGDNISDAGDTRTILWFRAWGINDLGQVCGIVEHRESHWDAGAWIIDINEKLAFRFTPAPEDLELGYPPPGHSISAATAINNWGDVLVFGSSGTFIWQANSVLQVEDLIPTYFIGRAINDDGRVTGSMYVAGGVERAGLFDGTSVVDLGVLGTPKSGVPAGGRGCAINVYGQVAGWASAKLGVHAFRYTNGVMKDLGVLSGFAMSSARGINSKGNGQVIGTVWTSNQNTTKQFLYTDQTGMLDLFKLIGNASALGVAASDFGGFFNNDTLGVQAINDYPNHQFGQICGSCGVGPYVLTPNQ